MELPLFDLPTDVEKEWVGMPEYDNKNREEPFITATFNFSCQEDFDEFLALIKECLYHGERPFDGMQRKHVKSTWYPPNKKASKFRYIDEP